MINTHLIMFLLGLQAGQMLTVWALITLNQPPKDQ